MVERSQLRVTPGWENALQANQLDGVDSIYRCEAGTVMTRSGSSEVRRIEVTRDNASATIFIKKYWYLRLGRRLRSMFRGALFGKSKVRREYDNLQWLRRHGLDAAEPIAYGEERRAGWLFRSCLVSQGVPGALPLDVFIGSDLRRRAPSEQKTLRRQLIATLASYTRRLHEASFVHHDYFWRNIILNQGAFDHFYLIDSHKGHTWQGSDGWQYRTQDLACLDAPAPAYFSRTDRLRFFLAYLGQDRLKPRDKSIIRNVLEQAEPMRNRQLRRVRKAAQAGERALPMHAGH